MRRSFSEKREIIHIVEQSELSVNRTLSELGIKRSTFYGWYKRYLEEGEEGLHVKPYPFLDSTNLDNFQIVPGPFFLNIPPFIVPGSIKILW